MYDKIKLDKLKEGLDKYTKVELEKGLKVSALKVLRDNEEYLRTAGLRESWITLFRSKRSLKKNDLLMLCSLPFLSKELYENWKSHLTKDVRTVWNIMVFEDKLHEDQIFENLKVRITKKKGSDASWYGYYEQSNLQVEFQIFKSYHVGSWNNTKTGILIPSPLRFVLKEYYDLPENAVLKVEDKIQETAYLFENSDQVILSELPRIYLYYSQKQIAVTQKNRPKLTSLPRMKKNLNLREFFPDDKDRKLATLRTNLLAGLIVNIHQRTKLNDPVDYIKINLVKTSFLNSAHTAALILTDLKGMGYLSGYDFYSVEPGFFNTLKKLPAEGWISIDRIYRYAKFNMIDLQAINEIQAKQKLYYEYQEDPSDKEDYYSYSNKHYTGQSKYENHITKPYSKGLFFMLSAVGLFDLAYDRPDRTTVGLSCYSAYDELKYVRMTPLGKYILGHSSSYEIRQDIETPKFTFSPQALTITLDENVQSPDFILKPYATRVGPNRFATDSQTFLKGIRSKKELEQKIALFKQVTNAKFPKNWEDFFSGMLQKVNPFETVKEPMTLYKLPPSNKAIIKLIAQDKYLKSYVLKAEDYHIIIPKSKLSAFKKRLLTFGYLVT